MKSSPWHSRFVATVAAIQYTGARAILVDIEPRAWTIDADAIRAAITPRTKAIVPVHLHGRPADMTSLHVLAKEFGLWLIEDASQAHGARHDGRRVGGIGDIGAFSFYPSKPLGALGEGGAIVTGNPVLAERARMLRNWGQAHKGEHDVPGFNMRMDALQAAMLRVKLDYVDAWSAVRARHANRYGDQLVGSIAYRPVALANCSDVHHVLAIETADRDRVRASSGRRRDRDGNSLPAPGPPCAGLREPRVLPRRLSAGGTSGRRDAFASAVRGNERGADRRGLSCRP